MSNDIITGSIATKAEEERKVSGSLSGGGITSSVEKEGNQELFKTEELGKDQFLNLLITTLRYQDPLNPASNEDFLAQMAQFSGLEAARNTNTSIEKLTEQIESMVEKQNDASNTLSQASSTNLLGKAVRIGASNVTYTGAPIKFKAHIEPGNSSVVSIVNKDNEVINVLEMVDNKNQNLEGDVELVWDGRTPEGKAAPKGDYKIEITTRDGSRDVGYAFDEGLVTGITYDKGDVLLTVDGNKRSFKDIIYVSENTSDNNNMAGAFETVTGQ